MTLGKLIQLVIGDVSELFLINLLHEMSIVKVQSVLYKIININWFLLKMHLGNITGYIIIVE